MALRHSHLRSSVNGAKSATESKSDEFKRTATYVIAYIVDQRTIVEDDVRPSEKQITKSEAKLICDAAAKLLTAKDAEIHKHAAKAIRKAGHLGLYGPEITAALKVVPSTSEEAIELLLKSAGDCGDDSCVPQLVSFATRSRKAKQVQAAFQSLGKLNTDAANKALANLIARSKQTDWRREYLNQGLDLRDARK